MLKNYFFAGILKVNDENSRIRIHTKMSWIRNTGFDITSLDGEEGLLAEAVADVLVCDVGQLVVRDVVQDVLNALLGPLQSNINIQM